ncbi:MAG: FmdB family zinc ribbon protein [Actinomycetota bacterium]
MPTYEYRCRICGHTFDVVQAMSDESLTVCPVCGGELRKVFAPVAISFKGSGFYATDHGKKSRTSSEKTGEKTGEKTAASTEPSDGKGGKKDNKESSKPAEKTAASSSSASSSATSSSGGSGSAGSTSDGKKSS